MVGSTVIPQAPSPSFLKAMQREIKCRASNGDMSIMKQVVNETSAYVLQQGQRKTFEGAELQE
jgi:hypothetical protein